MVNENLKQSEISDDNNEKIRKEFVEFIDGNKFTGEQMREAYYQLCGISENKNHDPAVEKILEKMNEISEGGFPLNRIADLVGAKENFEDAIPRYYQYIETLNISDKGKNTLRSIVEKKRTGEVECFVDGEAIADFKIRKSEAPIEALAEEMISAIDKIIERIPKGKKFEFTFIED